VSYDEEIEPEKVSKAIVPSQMLTILEERDHFSETYYEEELEI